MCGTGQMNSKGKHVMDRDWASRNGDGESAQVETRKHTDTEPAVPATDSARSGLIITKLARLPDKSLVDEQALAEALGVTKRTIRRMVGRYELPPPVSFAGRSMWQVQKVLRWFEGKADRLAREAERSAHRLKQRS